jgi:peroxiredoxin
MSDQSNYQELPEDLPCPEDDGAANHLAGMKLPKISLRATSGELVNLAELPRRAVIYAYPMTGVPGVPLPMGWDDIPGARGCTPQACAFRDHANEIAELRADVYGLSTQDTGYQRELVERLHLPFALLSDADLELARALSLPTMQVEGKTLLKRLTMIVSGGAIEYVFYPVFPSSAAASVVLDWLKKNVR